LQKFETIIETIILNWALKFVLQVAIFVFNASYKAGASPLDRPVNNNVMNIILM